MREGKSGGKVCREQSGEVGILFESPISIGLWVCATAMVVVPPLMRLRARRRTAPLSAA